MAKPPVKPDRDSASDADWQMARHREDAFKVLLETSSPLTPDAGRGLPFWTKLRACHSPADRSEFSQRTARWSRLAAAALEFYR